MSSPSGAYQIIDATSVPNGYLRSHDDFKFNEANYSSDLNNVFILEPVPKSSFILHIDFVYLKIGDGETCSDNEANGILKIFILSQVEPIFNCGNSRTPVASEEIIIPENIANITFKFETKSNNGDGFLLKYSSKCNIV